MKSLSIGASALLLTMLAPSGPPDVAGAWNVTIPAGSRTGADGSHANWPERKGTLTIVQTETALTATWTSTDSWTLRGVVDEQGRFALESEVREIPATRDGKKGRVPARWIFRGALAGGTLSGTASLAIGDRDPIEHRWTAVRRTGDPAK